MNNNSSNGKFKNTKIESVAVTETFVERNPTTIKIKIENDFVTETSLEKREFFTSNKCKDNNSDSENEQKRMQLIEAEMTMPTSITDTIIAPTPTPNAMSIATTAMMQSTSMQQSVQVPAVSAPSSSSSNKNNCIAKSGASSSNNTNNNNHVSNHQNNSINNHCSNSTNNSNNNNNNSSNPKMGSRRIFTPQFKLQVLESYRNDSDCKGNQRATSRKYNIHRRQIQKWLQCEANLRSSVANINQNNVKHQFHNITHNPQQQQQHLQPTHHPHAQQQSSLQQQQQHLLHQQRLSSATAGYNAHHHMHHHHHHLQSHPSSSLTIDAAARQTVALGSLGVPASTLLQPVTIAAAAGNDVTKAGGVLNAASLANLVAMPLMLGPLNHHHVSPASAAALPHPHPLHPHPYHQQFHNISAHTHTLPHHHHPAATSAFMSSACLPNVLSAAAAAALLPSAESTAKEEAYFANVCSKDPAHTLASSSAAEMISASKPLPILLSDESDDATMAVKPTALTGNSNHGGVSNVGHAHEQQEHHRQLRPRAEECLESSYAERNKDSRHLPIYAVFSPPPASSSPIDLSLNSRHRESQAHMQNKSFGTNASNGYGSDAVLKEPLPYEDTSATVVDLTFRKRKVDNGKQEETKSFNSNLDIKRATQTQGFHDDRRQPGKFAKLAENDHINENREIKQAQAEEQKSAGQDEDDDTEVDVEIEVDVDIDGDADVDTEDAAKLGAERKFEGSPVVAPVAKPSVKLFKPYLLDDNEVVNKDGKPDETSEMHGLGQQRAPIIWSNHPAYSSPHSCNDSGFGCGGSSNFQSPNTFPNSGSPYYSSPGRHSTSPQSAISPVSSVPALSPAAYNYGKGSSPVSGYESSSSTCSSEALSTSVCRPFRENETHGATAKANYYHESQRSSFTSYKNEPLPESNYSNQQEEHDPQEQQQRQQYEQDLSQHLKVRKTLTPDLNNEHSSDQHGHVRRWLTKQGETKQNGGDAVNLSNNKTLRYHHHLYHHDPPLVNHTSIALYV